MKEWVKKTVLKFKNYFDRIGNITKPAILVALHATVMSIIIGLFAAYFVHVNSEIRARQIEALSSAEEINKVHFKRYFYHPEGDSSKMPSGPEDMPGVIDLTVELAILVSQQKGGLEVGKIIIPEDPADRAEGILEIINIIVHRYPFPRSIDGKQGSFSQFRPEPIVFADFDFLTQWLSDLNEVIRTLKPVTSFMPLLFPETTASYLHALAVREQQNIDESRAEPINEIRGERTPHVIFTDFLKGISRAEEIYYSVLHDVKNANEVESLMLPKPVVLTVLIAGSIIFVFGVVLPLTTFSLHPFFYIHLPLTYYMAVFLMIIVKVALF